LARSATQGAQDLAVVRKPPRVVFRVDHSTVGEDVELAFAARDRLGVEAFAAQLGRETRGPCVIAASGRAVVDLDAHEDRS
jgi:hypothetical protein